MESGMVPLTWRFIKNTKAYEVLKLKKYIKIDTGFLTISKNFKESTTMK